MSREGSITHWINELKDGNRDAVQQLWERYFSRLVRLARNELAGTNRRVEDEEDLALSVFSKFCNAAENGRFPELADRDGLWRLLLTMTARKAIDQHRKHARQRRGGGNVRGESVFAQNSDNASPLADVIGDEPTPEFAAIVSEQLRRLLDILGNDELRSLALAKLEGFTNDELAQRHDCSTRTIERRLNLIRAKCNEEFFA
jgi:RNA polymerase sigma factor (sigma-70 family)